MAAASLITVGKNAANSADIVVTVGAPVTVAVKTTVGQPVRGYIDITLKGDAGNYWKVGQLDNLTRAVTLTGPGTYQLQRPTLSEATNDGLGAFSG